MMDIVTLIMACSVFQNYSITNAMIQVGSQDNYLMVTPIDGNSTIFPTEKQAINYAAQQLQQGNAVDIGIMQIPSSWLKTYKVTPAQIIKSCKNVVLATEIITQMWEKCGHIVSDPSDPEQVQACALSMFKTGNPKAGLDYATQVMNYANANPFEKIAAPAMAHWEKHAKVPKLPTATLSKVNGKPPVAVKQIQPPKTDTDDIDLSNMDTDPDLTVDND